MSEPCKCVGVTDAVHYGLAGRQIPTCSEHDDVTSTTTPIALNDSKALANLIGATLKTGDN